MVLKDISFRDPQENILYDDVLLHLAERGRGGDILRLWESPEIFVCLGRTSNEGEDLMTGNIIQDQIPVLRRPSGGGTVLQGKGCLNFSLVMSKARNPEISDLRMSYQFILNKIIKVLQRLDVDASFYPISDIALSDNKKKISGNAQKRARNFILHHGTILYDFDLDRIERYLRIPKDIPEYRGSRSHKDFLSNVALNAEDIKKAIGHAFCVDNKAGALDAEERGCLDEFLQTKNIYVKPSG